MNNETLIFILICLIISHINLRYKCYKNDPIRKIKKSLKNSIKTGYYFRTGLLLGYVEYQHFSSRSMIEFVAKEISKKTPYADSERRYQIRKEIKSGLEKVIHVESELSYLDFALEVEMQRCNLC